MPAPAIGFPPQDTEVLALRLALFLLTTGALGTLWRQHRKHPPLHPLKALALALSSVALLEAGLQAAAHSTPFLHPSPLHWTFRRNLVSASVPRPFGTTIVNTNELGFRGATVTRKKPPGQFRILCIGDSNTFGQGVADDETFPSQLESQLRTACPNRDIRVLNAGMPGYSFLQGCLVLESEGLPCEPDLVLMCGFNDVGNSTILAQEAMQSEFLLKPAYSALTRTLTYQVLRKEVSRFQELGKWPEQSEVIAGALRYARKAQQLLEERHIPVVFLSHLYDARHTVEGVLEPSVSVVLRQIRTSRTTRTADVTFDGWHTRRSEFVLPNDPFHPNAKGYREEARVVAPYLLREHLVRP